MNPSVAIAIILAYFGMLIFISYMTSRKATNDSFFVGERKSPWYLVSFGMIGASLSGVTFLSIPGWVGDAGNQMSYMQVVFGYFFGYLVIAYVLIPIYYRLNVVSIYEYLEQRFGFWSYKTGASFFLLSRIIGASVRLLLVANVLQDVIFEPVGLPFPVTVVVAILLIWIYTNRGGIKTIVWTDTLQTLFMLLAVILTVYFIADALNLKGGVVETIQHSPYSKIFFFEDFMGKNHFLKHFFGGMFITIGMTGLDQDMMQKNLSCKSIKDAQKNVVSMSLVLIVVNLLFLGLGALLYIYAGSVGIEAKGDLLYSTVALSGGLGKIVGVLFLLGLIAAAYSSADSALTSLTTSFSVDFLGVKSESEKGIETGQLLESPNDTGRRNERTRKLVHIAMSGVLVCVILILKYTTNSSAIGLLMQFAGFTYGPLIGLFFFGILTKRSLKDNLVPVVALCSIAATYILWYFSAGGAGVAEGAPGLLGDYKFGFELIIVNAIITFGGLMTISGSNKENV